MNTLLRLVLVVMFVPALISITRVRGARARAIRTICFVVILVFVAVAMFFPKTIEGAARIVRVNSGLDLTVYVITLTLVSFIALAVSKIRTLEKKIVILVQEIAILNYKIDDKDSFKTGQ